jgi:hypothetical protein
VTAEVEDVADGVECVSGASKGKAVESLGAERRRLSVLRAMLADHHAGAKLQFSLKIIRTGCFVPITSDGVQ